MANMKVEDLEGIGPAYADKLRDCGIEDTDALLEGACTPAGRKRIAEATGVPEKRILAWANMADLCRVRGIGAEFAELLEAAGVDTVKELRNRNADNLAAACAKVNEEKQLTRTVPSARVVAGWVEQAKKLPPKIEH